jgi:hypothetical protein
VSNYRAPLRIVQSNWKTGEIDPLFYMRVDAQGYTGSAKQLRNMLVRSTGAGERRPGMTTVADMGTVRRRLLEFEFDANEKYVLAFGDKVLAIYNAAGTLLQTLGTAWDATMIWEMGVIQRADVMIIVHKKVSMKRLRRTSLTSFVIESAYFNADPGKSVYNHPVIKYQPEAVAMQVTGTGAGATVTVICSAAIFNAKWVGERIRIYNCEIQLTALINSSHMQAVNRQPIRERLGIAPFRLTAGSGSVEVTHVQHGLTSTSAVTFTGVSRIFNIDGTYFNTSHTVYVYDEDHYTLYLPIASDTSGDGGGGGVTMETTYPTTRWMEQVFSDRHGWPGAVTLHENRLWFGGSTDLPTWLGGSAIGDYYDFNVRDGLDDESVQALISSTTAILHLVSSKKLQVFCEGSEAIVETQDGAPITPGTLQVVNQTRYGCDPTVRPRVFDGATIFAQRSGKNIRELVYDFNTDSHVASPISVRASHLINRPRDVAILLGTNSRPEQYAFYVNTDGSVACFHSIRNEEMAAWTHFDTPGGSFDSVCVIGTSVFFSVRRGMHYYLDRLELDQTDVWLDSARRMTGTGTSFNIGAAYVGQVVQVMAGGYLIGSFAVDMAGVITLPYAVTDPIVGYDYGIEVEPISFDMSMTDGPMTGEKRRIVSTTLHYHQSVSAAVNGLEQLGFTIGQDPSLPPPLISGKKRIRMLGYDRDPGFTITQPNPGPLTLLGLSIEVSI